MQDCDRAEFWSMINILMELQNRPPLSKESIVVWYNVLEQYDLNVVRKALDTWIDTETKPPTPAQIKELCKPKPDYMTKLAKPKPDKEVARKHLAHIKQILKINDRNDDAQISV
jgi:hypothetical protein